MIDGAKRKRRNGTRGEPRKPITTQEPVRYGTLSGRLPR